MELSAPKCNTHVSLKINYTDDVFTFHFAPSTGQAFSLSTIVWWLNTLNDIPIGLSPSAFAVN